MNDVVKMVDDEFGKPSRNRGEVVNIVRRVNLHTEKRMREHRKRMEKKFEQVTDRIEEQFAEMNQTMRELLTADRPPAKSPHA